MADDDLSLPEPASFEQTIPSPSLIAGVKAVWGPITSKVLCFGPRGDKTNPAFFSVARAAADAALASPFVLAIGGGQHVRPEIQGRAIEVARISSVYGETKAFVNDPEELERLSQWPVAVAAHDVYEIEGHPRLIDDLGFASLSVLTQAYDRVLRREADVEQLWAALRQYKLIPKELEPIPHFRDPGELRLVSTFLPRKASAEEGQKYLAVTTKLERNSKIARAAKEANREVNRGKYRCEVCGLTHEKRALFDAHHKVPLQYGSRLTLVSDFAVLCPTCHRIAHQLAISPVDPLTVFEVRSVLKGWV